MISSYTSNFVGEIQNLERFMVEFPFALHSIPNTCPFLTYCPNQVNISVQRCNEDLKIWLRFRARLIMS